MAKTKTKTTPQSRGLSPMGTEPRAGLYALVDDGLVAAEDIPQAVAALVFAGCDLVQLRLKNLDDRERLDVQRAVCAALPASKALTLVVNDRADLARILADEAPTHVRVGLHLGQTDLDPATARQVLKTSPRPVFLGLSTHTMEEVRAAAEAPVDYIGFGPIRATSTKAAEHLDPVVGFDALALAAASSVHPVVAIGGLTVDDALDVFGAGARWVAMAGELWRGASELPFKSVAGIVSRVRAAVDA